MAMLVDAMETEVEIKAIKPAELERVIFDTTVQEKAIAHPVDSRLLEIARHKVVGAAKRAGITLKQTFAKEGKTAWFRICSFWVPKPRLHYPPFRADIPASASGRIELDFVTQELQFLNHARTPTTLRRIFQARRWQYR